MHAWSCVARAPANGVGKERDTPPVGPRLSRRGGRSHRRSTRYLTVTFLAPPFSLPCNAKHSPHLHLSTNMQSLVLATPPVVWWRRAIQSEGDAAGWTNWRFLYGRSVAAQPRSPRGDYHPSVVIYPEHTVSVATLHLPTDSHSPPLFSQGLTTIYTRLLTAPPLPHASPPHHIPPHHVCCSQCRRCPSRSPLLHLQQVAILRRRQCRQLERTSSPPLYAGLDAQCSQPGSGQEAARHSDRD